MKIAYRVYVALCVVCGICFQSGKAHPDYFLGGFYGLIGSWLGPGILAKGLGQLFSLGSLGAPGMLAVSAAFWLLMYSIGKRSRRATASAAPVVSEPVIFSRSRFRTYTIEEE